MVTPHPDIRLLVFANLLCQHDIPSFGSLETYVLFPSFLPRFIGRMSKINHRHRLETLSQRICFPYTPLTDSNIPHTKTRLPRFETVQNHKLFRNKTTPLHSVQCPDLFVTYKERFTLIIGQENPFSKLKMNNLPKYQVNQLAENS